MKHLSARYKIVIGLTIFMAFAPLFFASNFYYRLFTDIYIYALAVTGLVILLGYAGQISLGHAGFAGVGAYAAALGPVYLGLPPLLCIVLGIVVSMAIAWLVGRPILRLRGHYLAVATLGMGLLIHTVLVNESWLTGGPDGMIVERLGLRSLVRSWDLGISSRQAWYGLTSLVLLAGVWLALNLRDSRTGRALRGLHVSENAAASVGIDVAGAKLHAFVISAAYASVSGSLLAQFNGFVSPEIAGFLRSVEWVAMAVLGGVSTVLGALVGAATLRSLPQLLSALAEYEHMLLGLVLMAIMIFLPRGVLPSITDWVLRRQS